MANQDNTEFKPLFMLMREKTETNADNYVNMTIPQFLEYLKYLSETNVNGTPISLERILLAMLLEFNPNAMTRLLNLVKGTTDKENTVSLIGKKVALRANDGGEFISYVDNHLPMNGLIVDKGMAFNVADAIKILSAIPSDKSNKSPVDKYMAPPSMLAH